MGCANGVCAGSVGDDRNNAQRLKRASNRTSNALSLGMVRDIMLGNPIRPLRWFIDRNVKNVLEVLVQRPTAPWKRSLFWVRDTSGTRVLESVPISVAHPWVTTDVATCIFIQHHSVKAGLVAKRHRPRVIGWFPAVG